MFTVAKGGLMYEASVGGQKFSYTPSDAVTCPTMPAAGQMWHCWRLDYCVSSPFFPVRDQAPRAGLAPSRFDDCLGRSGPSVASSS